MKKDEIVLALGNVTGELKGINQRLDTQNGAIKDHTATLGGLPCLAHLELIKAVAKSLEKIITEDKKQEERKEDKSFTRRTHIKAALIGALATGVIFLIVTLAGG